MLYAFRQELNVPHRSCGKFLIAVADAEIEKLAAIKAQAEANRVTDLVWLSEASALEPALVARRALLSPSTGIIDSHAFMLALRGDAERHGAMVALKTPVVSGRTTKRGLGMGTGGACPMEIEASLVVNAEGLGAQKLARSIKGMPADKAPPLHLAMGTYFWLASARPFRALSTRCRPEGDSACISPSTSAARPGSGRTSNGWIRSTMRSILAEPIRFTPRSEPIGPTCLTARCSPLTPAFDQNRPARRLVDRLSHPDGKGSRRRGPDQSIWDQVAGVDVEPGDRRTSDALGHDERLVASSGLFDARCVANNPDAG
jgi:hypothetical protein